MQSEKNNLYFMRRAVQEARKCEPEDDRVHPFVGAVLARDGKLIDTTYRGGKSQPGAHAEYLLLEHNNREHAEIIAGDTVYTTLEPCTTRNHPKKPCVEHLIARKVARVVIGMLDPNQAITGKGILRLREANIQVDLFPSDLMSELEDLNRHFISLHRTPADLMLPAWIGYKPLNVLVPHDARRVVLIGQNLSSRLGLNLQDQRKFLRELRVLLKQGTEVSLVIMPPSVLKEVHLEAAEDLARFTLPALESLADALGSMCNQVEVVFHPAATLSLLAVDQNYAYITPKFQKTAQISNRLTIKLEPRLFDTASLDRMLYDAAKQNNSALALSLDRFVVELRSQLVASDLLQTE